MKASYSSFIILLMHLSFLRQVKFQQIFNWLIGNSIYRQGKHELLERYWEKSLFRWARICFLCFERNLQLFMQTQTFSYRNLNHHETTLFKAMNIFLNFHVIRKRLKGWVVARSLSAFSLHYSLPWLTSGSKIKSGS